MGAQPADAAPPLPVGRQESRHLLCKLSDDNHHLMAPKRQRGPCLQRLWPLLQAAQCESAPPLPGDHGSLCCQARGPSHSLQRRLAWEAVAARQASPECQKGFP